MTLQIFTLKEGVTTRQINAAIRSASAKFCEKWNVGVVPNESRRNGRDGRRYVFGIGTSVRDTLVGHYVVGSGEVALVFPNLHGYRGWSSVDSYDQLRISIRDEVLHRSGLIDPMVAPRTA